MGIVNRLPAQTYEGVSRGINDGALDAVHTEMSSYKTGLVSAFDGFKGQMDHTAAFFGDHQAAVKGYTDKVMDKLADVLQQIDNFDNAIDTAKSNYAAQDASISSSLS